MRGSNPRLPRCKRAGTSSELSTESVLASTPSPVCTRVCTSESESANAGDFGAGFLDMPSISGIADQHGTDKSHTGHGAPSVVFAYRANSDEPDTGDPVAELAALLLTLSPADLSRLAKMLHGE